jgi:tRNA threonylcarbamoyl adenosine modification protein YeaZ
MTAMRLVIDTSTRLSVVGLATGRELLARSERETAHRHGAALLEQIDGALEQANAGQRDISAIGVGTGPGSFTGLRVGMATAKTIAYLLDVPIVGISSAEALARAAGEPSATVVLPAGAHDAYLSALGDEPVLVPQQGLVERLGDRVVVAVDMPDDSLLGQESRTRGSDAVAHLADALVELLDERLSAGSVDDVTTLVPVYVALPRGISASTAEMEWSPDLR